MSVCLSLLCFIYTIFVAVAATIGFIGAPYYVNESTGTATLTIGVINGSIHESLSLSIQLQDGSAVGMSVTNLDIDNSASE